MITWSPRSCRVQGGINHEYNADALNLEISKMTRSIRAVLRNRTRTIKSQILTLAFWPSVTMEPRHERKRLMYLRWDKLFEKEKPYQIVSENIPELDDLARSNIEMVEGPEELIEDIRGREEEFSLDEDGFQIITHRFRTVDYQNNNEVETVYKPEIERLLKQHVAGVDKVVFFNWRVCLSQENR